MRSFHWAPLVVCSPARISPPTLCFTCCATPALLHHPAMRPRLVYAAPLAAMAASSSTLPLFHPTPTAFRSVFLSFPAPSSCCAVCLPPSLSVAHFVYCYGRSRRAHCPYCSCCCVARLLTVAMPCLAIFVACQFCLTVVISATAWYCNLRRTAHCPGRSRRNRCSYRLSGGFGHHCPVRLFVVSASLLAITIAPRLRVISCAAAISSITTFTWASAADTCFTTLLWSALLGTALH